MFEGIDVAVGAFDAKTEAIADPSRIAAGGVSFGEDAIFAESLRADTGLLPGIGPTGGHQPGRGSLVDDQVRVL